VHTLVGAGAVGRGGGGGGGGLDISNLMKPALARGDLQCIGATTLDEHRKYIEKDTALERRFQPIMVEEPSAGDTLAILQGLQKAYERHHHCTYTDDAIRAAVSLADRYIADRYMPDKAIDLIDEAGSRARIQAYLANQRLDGDGEELGAAIARAGELRQVMSAKAEAIGEGLYEEAALLLAREGELMAALAEDSPGYLPLPAVGVEEIEQVVAAWTGIPVQRMQEGETERLRHLGADLAARVVGQDSAIAALSRAITRNSSGLKDPARPIGGFLFCGPTGVGKTELTKALAEVYFGDAKAMIRLDMSEFMERHSVSKLVGSPPGYVGHGEGGKLTEAVRRKPFSIVLLDEVEKAHPDVFNILLQVLEDGRLTDSQGRTVSFKNTLIVMTSNIGSAAITKGAAGLGFQLPSDDPDGGKYERVRSLVMEEVKNYFRPEMLNRLDDIIVFHQLARAQIRTIADIVLAQTAARLEEQRGVGLQVTERAMARILEDGYDEDYGARPLRRAVTNLVDDALSDLLLSGAVQPGETVTIDADEESGEVFALTPAQVDAVEQRAEVVYSSAL
jgi:ATP-dependent Clp protease ATP-binding subunit ClpC